MSHFTDKELEYMTTQQLGRLATLSASGDPHVIPVAYKHNPALDTIDIYGRNMSDSKKFKDIARDGRTAFVIDDVLPPWQARGIEIRGQAQAIQGETAGQPEYGDGNLIRISPTRIISWGLETEPYKRNSRNVPNP